MTKPSNSDENFYWWNSRLKVVEVGPVSKALDRVGPFKTRAEAERAEQILAERAAAWREQEEREA